MQIKENRTKVPMGLSSCIQMDNVRARSSHADKYSSDSCTGTLTDGAYYFLSLSTIL